MAVESFVSFTGGEWSDKMAGRTDLQAYKTACRTLENFIVLPQGPAQTRPGTRFIQYAEEDTDTWLIDFIASDTTAYIFEAANYGFLVYKINPTTGVAEPVMDGVDQVRIPTHFLISDMPSVKVTQANDTMYLAHPDRIPYKIIRGTDTVWSSYPVYFDLPPLIEKQDFHDCTVSLSYVDEGKYSRVTRTGGAITEPFISSDLNKEFIAGTGRGIVVGVPSKSEIIIQIVSTFDASSYVKDTWYLEGSPFVNIQVAPVGSVGYFAKDYACFLSGVPATPYTYYIDFAVALNVSPAAPGWWGPSGAIPGEYFLGNFTPAWSTLNGYGGGAAGPAYVQHNGVAMTFQAGWPGVPLGLGEWAFGNNDALGYNTVYVRLGVDPDTLSPTPNTLQFWYQTTAEAFKPIDVGKFVEVGGGIVEILGFYGAGYVSGIVRKQVQASLSSIPKVYQWAFDETRGYPSQITFHQNRLVLAGSAAYPRTIWMSESNSYESFALGSNASDSISATLADRGMNSIKWVLSRGPDLLTGSDAGEWNITSSSGIITPSDIAAKLQTSYGGENITPVIKDGIIIFVQKMGLKLRGISFDFATDGYIAPDMTILAEHVLKSGVKQMAYQQMPIGTIWILRNDGVLVGFDYDRAAGQVCFHRHTTDGTIKSIAVIPHPTEARDVLFLAVQRTVNGSPKIAIETMEDIFNEGDTLTTCWQLDSAVEYDGVSTNTLTSAHLARKQVAVIDRTSGQYIGDFTADSTGTITLVDSMGISINLTKALYGLMYTRTIKRMRIANSNVGGSAQAQKKHIPSMWLRVWNSVYAKVGTQTANLEEVLFREVGMNTDAPPSPFTGDRQVYFNGGREADASYMVIVDKPYPCTILAIYPEINYSSGTTGQ